jgi:hypothetical protein
VVRCQNDLVGRWSVERWSIIRREVCVTSVDISVCSRNVNRGHGDVDLCHTRRGSYDANAMTTDMHIGGSTACDDLDGQEDTLSVPFSILLLQNARGINQCNGVITYC